MRTSTTSSRVGGAHTTYVLRFAFVVAFVCTLIVAATPAGAVTMAWRVQSTPNAASELTELRAVSCPTVDYCIAVGMSGLSGPDLRLAVAQRWTQAGWTSLTPVQVTSVNLNEFVRLPDFRSTSCESARQDERTDGGG